MRGIDALIKYNHEVLDHSYEGDFDFFAENYVMDLLKELLESDCLITEEQLYEMARVQLADSGIPVHIYVSTKNVVHGAHGPRIKISNVPNTFSSSDNFVVSINKDPKLVAGKWKCSKAQLEDIYDWVKLNYEPLMKYWNNEYKSDALFFDEIKKI